MKSCLPYGNCQTDALRFHLPRNEAFLQNYHFPDLKPVHLLTQNDIPKLEEIISEVDVFIYQPISDNYKGIPQLSTNHLLSKVKSSCQKISIPVAYFTGYNPEMIYLRSLDGKTLTSPFPYYDKNVVRMIVDGFEPKKIYDNLQREDFYSDQEVSEMFNKSIQNLKMREKDLAIDIPLSEFILKHHRIAKLFHTFNHPNNSVLAYLGNQILMKLGLIDANYYSFDREPDTLKRNSFPIYNSIRNILQLEFESQSYYVFNNDEIEQMDFISTCHEFLSKHPEIIQFNQNKL